MKVFAYLRVSGKGQIEGDGPERQRLAIASFAAKHGLELAGEGFDGGVSGTIDGMDRPEFARLVSLCSNGGGIVVERLDRLARDLMVQELLLAECRKAGIPVFSADGELVDMASCDGDPTRKLIRQVMGAVAEFEKSSLVLKLRSARQRVKAKTGRCEGAKPYGSLVGEDTIITQMLEHFGKVASYSRTAKWLNCKCLYTRGGTPWNRGTVWAVIRKHNHEMVLHESYNADAGSGAGGTGTPAGITVEQRVCRELALDRVKRHGQSWSARRARRWAHDFRHAGSIRDFLSGLR